MTGVGPDAAAARHVGSRRAPRGLLLTADRVVTLGHGRYKARALLLRGSRVVWVGDDVDQAPPHARRLDFDGCVIGPAFVDAHAHLTATGITLSGLDLSTVGSWAEVLDAVRVFADAHTGGVVWGHGFDPHTLPDEPPDPQALTDAAGRRVVYLSRVDGHSALVDRRTLQMAPLARASGVERDARGRPTGWVFRDANHVVRRWSVGSMSHAELGRARSAAAAHAAALGIASVHEMGGPDLFGAADFDAWREGEWPIEIVPYWASLDVEDALRRDLRQIGGDLLLDGSLGSHTAALGSAYDDRPGVRGRLELDDDTLVRFFVDATTAGLQAAVHAIGDAAIRQAVRCYRAAEAALPDHLEGAARRLHHRLEHAVVMPPELIDEVAELGLIVSAQPSFELAWGGPDGLYAARLGPTRAAWTGPFRALADRGVPLAFGSDSNVRPMDPWRTVYAAQHRAVEQHAVTRLEAVSASSLGGRFAAGQERFVGVVRAGMRADLAVWENDPFRADDPRDARCVLTLLAGRPTHSTGSVDAFAEPRDRRVR